MTLRYLSVCSGIEAASVAWHPLGWRPWAFAEVEAFPSAVLAHHYPNVPNLGDMTGFKDWPNATLDLLCGGTPCQSFSNAGLRAGLDDPRGQLMLTFGAIAARYRPKWLVWENVPGVLSSNGGRDFGAFLGLLGFLGYGFAYRVLDAQFVRVDGYGRAVPQRRQRVFVVGCLGDWRSAAAVLLERESLRGDSAPRRSAGARVAGVLAAGSGGGCGPDDNDARANHLIAAYGGNNGAGSVSVSTALTAHPGGRYDYDSETFIAHTLRGEGFDASEDGTGRGTPLVPWGVRQTAPTLTTTYGKQPDSSDTNAGPMLIPMHAPEAHPTMVARSSRGGGQTNTPGHNADETLIAFSSKDHGADATVDLAPTLRAMGHASSRANGGGQMAVAFHPTQDPISGRELCHALGANANATAAVHHAAAVRRLMPVECERLQGFPDGYTAIPWRGKPASQCPDGPRYKALGNSWAVNCARWIGRRISLVELISRERAA